MDTSNEYVRMCIKATEIQALWQPIRGDVYYAPFRYTDIHRGCHVIGNRKAFKAKIAPNPATWRIWLPRQDQLQEILNVSLDITLNSFIYWEEGSGYIRERDKFSSMEQLWLACVMSIEFGKYWDTQNWVTEIQRRR